MDEVGRIDSLIFDPTERDLLPVSLLYYATNKYSFLERRLSLVIVGDKCV